MLKNAVLWSCVVEGLNGKEIVGTFYQRELQKTYKAEFGVGKVIKRKGDKLLVKWKECDNYFNSWIDKKDLVK